MDESSLDLESDGDDWSPFIYICFFMRLIVYRLSSEACVSQQPLSLMRDRLCLGVERNLEQTSCFLSGVAQPTPKASNTLCPLRILWADSKENRAMGKESGL